MSVIIRGKCLCLKLVRSPVSNFIPCNFVSESFFVPFVNFCARLATPKSSCFCSCKHVSITSLLSAPASPGSCVSRTIRSKAEPSSSSAGWEGAVHRAHGMADTHGVGTSSGCSNIHFHQQKPPTTKIQPHDSARHSW